MRLLNTGTLEIQEFHGDCHEDYAILSHTWGEDECTLQDMTSPTVATRKGYAKILLCCQQAAKEGIKWAWVDTCCIDKTSSNELSEAINSMFRWYQQSKICYAFLTDVDSLGDLPGSRWFTRGWTLQELIAPKQIRFYSSNWTDLGLKTDDALQKQIQNITGVEGSVLSSGSFDHVCAAKKMSWAANRQTTRVEDRAYSLLGLFDVNMPLIYGEGPKAFVRLQREILKVSDDQSIFAWGIQGSLSAVEHFLGEPVTKELHGPFAGSPADFAIHRSIDIRPIPPTEPATGFLDGVELRAPISSVGPTWRFLALRCVIVDHAMPELAIPLRSGSRDQQLVLIPSLRDVLRGGLNAKGEVVITKDRAIRLLFTPQSIRIRGSPRSLRLGSLDDISSLHTSSTAANEATKVKGVPTRPVFKPPSSFRIRGSLTPKTGSAADEHPLPGRSVDETLTLSFMSVGIQLDEVYCLSGATYCKPDQSINFTPAAKGPLAVLFFEPGPNWERWKCPKVANPSTVDYVQDFGSPDTSIVCPFAVILGMEAESQPFLSVLNILRDDSPHEDFHTLLHKRQGLERFCTTKAQLKSALPESARGDWWQNLAKEPYGVQQPLAHWSEEWESDRTKSGSRYHLHMSTDFQNRVWNQDKCNILLEASIYEQHISPLETTAVVRIDVTKTRERTETIYRRPKPWNAAIIEGRRQRTIRGLEMGNNNVY